MSIGLIVLLTFDNVTCRWFSVYWLVRSLRSR